jgi:hypothetical protein
MEGNLTQHVGLAFTKQRSLDMVLAAKLGKLSDNITWS